MTVEFDAELWLWEERAGHWTFVALPAEVADEVLELSAPYARGFGSVRVEVTVGTTVWRTSIFPDAGRRTYVLPIKKAVRRAESVDVGDTIRVTLRLLDL
ncbi:DUF1905 domain-containing protein [Georgenia faecalis]|uniref:DUF1905 domain-containing protein n=1 Tax=Georgenia faecalis TaxID=2483799 RepID=A0ABV9DAV0_9MICO|nr:DUF1905 domain-containing protein [Georgenia faecalis]